MNYIKKSGICLCLVLLLASSYMLFASEKIQSSSTLTNGDRTDYFIRISDPERLELISKCDDLEIGMTRERVREILGDPTYITEGAPKESDEPIAIFWEYYLTKLDSELVNLIKDEYIMLVFDKQGMLIRKSFQLK